MLKLRLAARSLARTPLVTAVAVLSLALGIGATGAIFSIYEWAILRALPVVEPDRLVNLTAPGPKPGSQSTNNAGDIPTVFSYPMTKDLEAAETGLAGLAAHRTFGANLAFAGDTLAGEGLYVSGGYFLVLGLRPAAGRLIGPEDDRTIGAHPVVVLAHGYWRSRFGGDSSVIGRAMMVNGKPMTILGVAPRGFEGTTLGQNPQVFVPISMRGELDPRFDGFEDRRSYWVYLFARLAPGQTMAQAAVALNQAYRPIIQEVELPLQAGSSSESLERFAAKEVLLEPGGRGQSVVHELVRTPLLMLLLVTLLVLLIASANVVNLLLARAADRAGDIAVQLSLGARPRHLVAQLLAESFLIALGGAALGLVVALGTLQGIDLLVPDGGSGGPEHAFGPMTWIFLAALTVVTGLAGLFPAFVSTRADLISSVRGQAGLSARSRSASLLRTLLVSLQIALATTLLIAAGLFARSLLEISRVDLGLEVERLATFGLSPQRNGYAPEASRELFRRVEETLGALPGVERVAASMVPLISGSNWGTDVSVDGFPSGPEVDRNSRYNEVGPGFFRTMRIPLLRGREFTDSDALGAPEVAVVNRAFARKFELGDDAVGGRMQVGSGDGNDIEIVGLVADAKYSEVKGEVPPTFYLPYRQDENLGRIHFYVRTAAEPESLLPTLRKTVASLDPNLPVENLQTMALQVRDNIFLDRMLSTLSAAFALLASLLAAVGLYGVLAYAVSQRRREIGLRMALGADAGRVSRLILRYVAWMTAAGAVVGLAAALGLGRIARSLLYGIRGHDPAVLAGALFLLLLVALLSGLGPALRAARTDPIEALRDE